MRPAQYAIEAINDDHILIRDIGPHDRFSTVTNDAERVVQQLAERLGSRRLFYIDSDGNTDELLVENGRFAGFSAP